MKVALVYDRVNKWGGAERVLLALHGIFPDAPLYTSVYDSETAPWAKVYPAVIPSFLQKIPFAKDRHEHFPYMMPIAFESFNFDEYGLVISVTSEAAKGIITKPKTKHVCYCLTPTRYLWSGYDTYFLEGSAERTLSKPVVGYLRMWDKIAAQRPDVMAAISKTVQNRIKKYYGRESEVIYPPVSFQFPTAKRVTLSNFQSIFKSQISNFYLIVSRLVPYKKVDLAVEVFNQLGWPLVIVGTGSHEGRLKEMAKPNIKFVGQLTDRQLHDYYERCTALIMPQEEDFGIVSLEAQIRGKPVIAYKKGGASETVIDGRTGILFNEQSVGSLTSAIKRFKEMRFERDSCIENAKRFSKERFKKEFLSICI